jgi:PAS domain S-box-containing protein
MHSTSSWIFERVTLKTESDFWSPAMISEDVESDGAVNILADSTGVIQFASEIVLRTFGYPGAEIAGENVSILMPDSHAFSHAGYMSRYMDTGESNIGMI